MTQGPTTNMTTINAYAAAARQTRLEYARYIAICRETGEKPKTFTNWLKELN